MRANQENAGNLVERSLEDINLSVLTKERKFYPSPVAWEDQVLYFLLLDRFSDGKEYGGFADLNEVPIKSPTPERSTPLFDIEWDAWKANRQVWFDAGKTWCGGTIAGLKDKLGYLKRLGVTVIWLSPIFKQVTGSDTYHGYGIQNFLDVDRKFGTREELKDFVAVAHSNGIRVILDIILNHAGNVFAYQGDLRYFYWNGQQWPVQGFRQEKSDTGSLPFGPTDINVYQEAWPNGAIWPDEFQKEDVWTREGEIIYWDNFPEYLDGDFSSFKDINHGQAIKDLNILNDPNGLEKRIDGFRPSHTLFDLINVYKFWIAYADIDGFRVDTVKHVEPGAMRIFANAIHEFAQSLGKENFYIIGEVTGGRAFAVDIVDATGIDAALSIDDGSDSVQSKLEFLAKGKCSPKSSPGSDPNSNEQKGYFDLFTNGLKDDKATHQWYGKHIVVMFDDHDQVGTKYKFRFCGDSFDSYKFLPVALGLNLTTAGIPCIYYGTEQAFNGADHRTDDDSNSDVFLRECMFGGPFGSFQSTGRHFFNEGHEIYQFIKKVCALRRDNVALRRGRQYLREVSITGQNNDFYYPQPVGGELHWVVAWSRVFADSEYLCAINTDANQPLKVWATVDNSLNHPGNRMKCLFSTDPNEIGEEVDIENRNGSAININVPKAGFVVYQ